jgi:hypothetical protein
MDGIVHKISACNFYCRESFRIKLEPLNNLASPLFFFAGFSIINKHGKVIGSLSLIGLNPQNLSTVQNKIIFNLLVIFNS